MVNIATVAAQIARREANHGIVLSHFLINFAKFACAIVRTLFRAQTDADHTWFAHTLSVLGDVFQTVGYIHIVFLATQGTHHNVGTRSHTRIWTIRRTCTNKCRVAAVRARCQIRGEAGNASGIKFRARKHCAVNRHFRAAVVGWHIHTLDASVAQ